MITPGKTMDDHLMTVTHSLADEDVTHEEGIPCEGSILFSKAFMASRSWLDDEAPGRPYMHMVGECLSLRGNLPQGVSQLNFEEHHGIPVDILYEFSDEQLAGLVSKGLYSKGFKCPDILTGDSFIDMPVYVDVTAVSPDVTTSVPILFADIENRKAIITDMQACGYDFAEYFEQAVPPEEEENTLDFDTMPLEDEDELFADERDKYQSEPVEKPKELSAEEKALRERYENIHDHVMKEHVEREHIRPQHEAHLFDEPVAEPVAEPAKETLSKTFPEKQFSDEVDSLAVDVNRVASNVEKPDYHQYIGKDETSEQKPEEAQSTVDIEDEDDDLAFLDDDVFASDDGVFASDKETESKDVAEHMIKVDRQQNEIAEDEGDFDHDGDRDADDDKIAEDIGRKSKPVQRQVSSNFENIADKADKQTDVEDETEV